MKKTKIILTILFAFLFLGGVKAQMQLGTFRTLYSGENLSGYSYYDGAMYYLIDNTPGRAPIHVYDSETGNVLTSNSSSWSFDDADDDSDDREVALDVFWALQQIRDRLFDVHGINGYDKDNVNPAKPYSC